MRALTLLALVILSFVKTPPVNAGSAGRPVEIEGAREHVLTSSVNGQAIRILVWQPTVDAPANGYPVVYAFDGDKNFGHFSDSARGLEFRARQSGRLPPVVVGIGYPKGQYTLAKRNFDLTPPAARYDMPERPNGRPWPKMGGGNMFLDTIERDIKPFVRRHYPVDPEREALFGHSFGGMMVLHALFNRNDGYTAYIAASPSIWFNGQSIMRDAQAYLTRTHGGDRPDVSLRISVGGNEQTIGAWEKAGGRNISQRAAWLASNRMVDNARELAELIRARGGDRINLQFDVIDGEGHGSVVPAAVYRALLFAIGG